MTRKSNISFYGYVLRSLNAWQLVKMPESIWNVSIYFRFQTAVICVSSCSLNAKKDSINKSSYFSFLNSHYVWMLAWRHVNKGQGWKEKNLIKKIDFEVLAVAKHIKRNYWENCGTVDAQNSLFFAVAP